ncbi:MAG: hypothetical protein K1X74_10585 [Pirellulales bacterium]|nr:hypothetical protein [Pirellulales bacterium]
MLETFAEIAVILGVAAGIVAAIVRLRRQWKASSTWELVPHLLYRHFYPLGVPDLTIRQRTYSERIRPDLQIALDSVVAELLQVERFCGVTQAYEGHSAPELS